MLNKTSQRGVVLLVSLIILVALSLAGVALVRSVDTTNIIAGNLAFQKAATAAADAATELALQKLISKSKSEALYQNDAANGYAAATPNFATPMNGKEWEAYWWQTIAQSGGPMVTLAANSEGNTVSYTIQRLCEKIGSDKDNNECVRISWDAGDGSAESGGIEHSRSQVAFRITSRVVGPRNTVSMVQSVVAM